MSRILDKAFDATKRIVRAVFLGSPNLFTTSDLNRQIEAFKYQLDQSDDKVGFISDMTIDATVNSGILGVLPSYTTIKNKGIEFAGITGLQNETLVSAQNIENGVYVFYLWAEQSLINSGDDPTHGISGATFEDGSYKPAASHYVVSEAHFDIKELDEYHAAKGSHPIVFPILYIHVSEGDVKDTTKCYVDEEGEENVLVVAHTAENISKEALYNSNRAIEVCRETAATVSAEAIETSRQAKAIANRVFPLGGITMWGGDPEKVPEGFHLCDGASVEVTEEEYSNWGAMGYQVGNSFFIRMPDLRARFVVGYDSRNTQNESHDINEDYDQIGKTGGSQEITLTSAQSGLPAHSHSASSHITPNNLGKYGGEHYHKWFGDDQIKTFVQAVGGHDLQAMRGYDATSTLSEKEDSRVYGTSDAGDHTHTIETTINNAIATDAAEAHENRPPYYVVAYIIRIS